MIGAFFDVDGTLYNATMWRGLLQYVAAHGGKARTRWYMLRNLPFYYLRKLKWIDEETFRTPWVMTLGSLIKDWDTAQTEAAFRWVVEHYIEATANPDLIMRLRNHVTHGHTVVLVSAMLAPALELIGEHLGVAGTVGTALEFVDGRCTGRVIPPVCMGADKARLTKEWLNARGITLDFAASYAYADSISDLALLEMVGHPVAVYPDAQLAALARARHWDVIEQAEKQKLP